MAVLEVNEIWDNVTGREDEQGWHYYVRCFRIHTDNMTTGMVEIINHPDLPHRGDTYTDLLTGDEDTLAVCKEVDVKTTDEPHVFIFIATYNSNDPLDLPIEVQWGQESRTEPIWYDKDGNLVVNSAGDPFDPPVMVEIHRPTLTVSKSFLTYDRALYEPYALSVNNDVWLGYPAGQVKCTTVSAVKVIERERITWRVTFVFVIEKRANYNWQALVLDQGWRYLESDPASPLFTTLRPAVDQWTGQPSQRPALLNGIGVRLPHGDDPVFHQFTVLTPMDYSALDFITNESVTGIP